MTPAAITDAVSDIAMSPASRALIEKLLHQQNALAEFGSYAFRTHDLSAVLNRATEVCAKCTNTLCKICCYRPERNDLLLVAGAGWKADVIGIALSAADQSTPAGRAFVTREAVVCSDLRHADFVLPSFYAEHAIIATANVVIPGTDGGVPFGVLEVDSLTVQDYDDLTLDFLTGFANVLAEAVGTAQRITTLKKALAEKEMLSRELQHRVRNNLHVINSMLDVETNHQQPDVERFYDIANRVRALATMYDHLLGIGMGRTLAFDQYLEKLCVMLRTLRPPQVQLRQRPMPTVNVDIDTATLLGIAVTEIITNCFKHAFPNGQGVVELVLDDHPAPRIQVVDDGIGITRQTGSKRYGLGLVRRLVEQVNGTLDIRQGTTGGTCCEIILSTAS